MAKSKFFVYYNPNPTVKFHKDGKPMKWGKCDCSTRAMCKALDMEWSDVFNAQVKIAMKEFDMPNSTKVINKTLDSFGFIKQSVGKGKKPSVSDFCIEHKKGTYVLHLSGHVVCVKDGMIYDTWDCSKYKVYTYYQLSK